MFKVICIDNKGEHGGEDAPELTVGAEYTVIDLIEVKNYTIYAIAELEFLYDSQYFALLNGPDETEIAEARAEREGIRLDCELTSLIQRIEFA